MRVITNAQLASAARLAMLEGRLGAPKGNHGALSFGNGAVCAIGAVLDADELHKCRGTGMPNKNIAIFEDPGYARSLAGAHDQWGRLCGGVMRIKSPEGEKRAKFLALIDQHDPIRALERAANEAAPSIPRQMFSNAE